MCKIKKCVRCTRILNVSNFSKNKKAKDGRSSFCKECHTKYTKKQEYCKTKFFKNSNILSATQPCGNFRQPTACGDPKYIPISQYLLNKGKK